MNFIKIRAGIRKFPPTNEYILHHPKKIQMGRNMPCSLDLHLVWDHLQTNWCSRAKRVHSRYPSANRFLYLHQMLRSTSLHKYNQIFTIQHIRKLLFIN